MVLYRDALVVMDLPNSRPEAERANGYSFYGTRASEVNVRSRILVPKTRPSALGQFRLFCFAPKSVMEAVSLFPESGHCQSALKFDSVAAFNF